MKPEISAFIAFPAQSCTLVSHHRPHRKVRRFGDGWFGRIRWIFPNRGRQDCLQRQGCRTHLTCCVDSTRKPGRLPQEPHPPRGRFPHSVGEMSRSDKGGRAACGNAPQSTARPARNFLSFPPKRSKKHPYKRGTVSTLRFSNLRA